MTPLSLCDSHEPALRVESLHALAYCRRLYYLQEIERISVGHEKVYAGRQLHAALEADEDGEAVAIELSDEALGLIGKVDAIKRRKEWSGEPGLFARSRIR